MEEKRNRKKISVVIPVFREEKNLEPLHKRLVQVCDETNYSFEYVFVNDGSPDDSLSVLKKMAIERNDVKIIDLSRNFGKEIALTAGVHEVEDVDAIICIDADLQHPPELIPRLINEWESGSDVVVTIRKTNKSQPWLKVIGSRAYYWLLRKISSIDVVPQSTDFRLYDRKVVSAFRHATERERMFRGIMDWMGFKRSYVEFKAPARLHGEAGYSYKKLWRLAVNSITSFSLFPLKVAGYLGGVITLITALGLSWVGVAFILNGAFPISSLGVFVLFNTLLIGIVLMSIGLVALYVGTIHTEVINRPLYIIRERINI